MATVRAFGKPINGQRKALGTLNLKSYQENKLPELKQRANAFTKQSLQAANDQKENRFEFETNFIIYDEKTASIDYRCVAQNNANNQEEILHQNIQAVEKELNSFLIDSHEKSNGPCQPSSLIDEDHHFDDYVEDAKENERYANDISMKIIDDLDDEIEADKDRDLDDDAEEEAEQDENRTNIEISCRNESKSEDIFSEQKYQTNHCDLELLADYSDSILIYMLQKERQYMPNPFYMNKQQQINSKMRSILIDWLVDVADEYDLKDETLFLAINYIDRHEFQLLGTSAIFIASKYEEVYPPYISDFSYITDDSFSKAQILAMEQTILTYLTFLTQLECTPFLKYYPSEIALCSILLAAKILKLSDQIPQDFIDNSVQYEKNLNEKGDLAHLLSERKNLIEELNQIRIYASNHQQQAIQKKYSSEKYLNVFQIANEAKI
ncbi:cyclin a-like protein [Sarcoptes scabiei]|uniref:Cyclin a-like protein n=1 Tax=Sarcoptes scabiei TaxID=52283 RepID=A0A131ZX50_SARSC|nr:cyclin a-like protein [Sarcoptes scabiei]